jgi:cysteine-rich repeat protein
MAGLVPTLLGGLVVLFALAFPPREARANCNVIPAATNDFRAALGSTNRPYASPGDVVELRVRPAVCDARSTGFVDLDGDASRSDDHVVTVVFTPPGSGTPNAVVVAESCAGIDLAACGAQLGGGSASCVAVSPAAEPPGLAVLGSDRLQVRFPDTDARVDAADDDRTLVGPARIAVTRRGAPLPCQLATQRCTTLGGDTLSNGVVACVDELFELDGTCRTGAAQRAGIFGHFTALPPPNDLERMITAPGTTEVHLTTDDAGNLIVPMDYAALLLRIGGRPVPLIARANAVFDAFAGGIFEKVDIPASGFAGSYSPEGVALPPVFSPLSDGSSSSDAILFGSVDAPRGIVRVARQACVGGSHEGLPCTSDPACEGGGTCTGPILEVRDRYHAGVGPVNLVAGQYLAVRETPITLESVAQRQASGSFAFVVYEGFDGEDRNGDGDATDFVLTLRDRETGVLRPIGPGQAIGRAIVQVREGRFATPALESEGDLVAFLESEPGQGAGDANGNGEVADPVLRIYRLEADQATELTTSATAADAALAFAGRVGAWLGERFFFRSAEARQAAQTTGRVSVATDGGEPDGISEAVSFGAPPRGPATSADGRYVVFHSAATDLVAGDGNGFRDCFVLDRDSDGDGFFDEPGATTIELASVATGGTQADSGSDQCVLSASGRFVAFGTGATNLDSGGIVSCDGSPPGGCYDIVVRDRVAGTTTRASLDAGGGEADARSLHPSLSADGRFVAFSSVATDFAVGDANGVSDVFVRDRCLAEGSFVPDCTPRTVRVSIATNGSDLTFQGNPRPSEFPALSADGRFVTFTTANLGVLVHDRDADEDGAFDEPGGFTTEVVSVDRTGLPTAVAQLSSISGDGRFVAFESPADTLVPGDTNVEFDVFVRDRLLGTTERVSVASDGSQASLVSAGPFLSQDGRYVTFWSRAPELVASDTNVCIPDFGLGSCQDVFVHDRVTGATRRVSVSTDGDQGDEKSHAPSLSPDGRFVVFESLASSLVAGDAFTKDVFVRGPDTNPVADRSGDAVADDTLLRVADASGGTASLAELCPGEAVAVAGSHVAFLRPEAAGKAGAPAACVQPSADRNGDGDAADRVVQVYDGVAVHDLGCAATDVTISATHLAALVSECEEAGGETDGCPSGGTDFSGDGDAADRVLAVHAFTDPLPTSCAGFVPTTLAGSMLGVSGGIVALRSEEVAQSNAAPPACSLNDDADCDDGVLRLVDATTGLVIPLVDDQQPPQPVAPPAIEDFVIGPAFVALRTRESAQSDGPPPACSRNGDADCDDDVLRVVLLATGTLLETGQAVVPCFLPECNPRKPYRLSQDTVRFLTYEADQGQDLNQDGDTGDLLVQVFNVQSRLAKVVAEVAAPEPAAEPPPPGAGSDPLASPSEESATEQSAQVAVAVGRCVEDGADPCSPEGSACAAGEFCFAEPGATTGSCVRDTGAACFPDRVAGEQGCLLGAVCVRDFVVLAIADRDTDQVPDAIDNCPALANTEQADADQDGVGDSCDLQTCGDGALQLDEQCDDGNLASDDGCDANCRLPACGNGIVNVGGGFHEACDDGNLLAGDGCSPGCAVEQCSNGVDDDGDGYGDAGSDLGCSGLEDLSERGAEPCDDGLDNDGDGLVDHPADPGCGFPWYRIEDPACDDGIDNDGDGGIDWDGAGQGPADPQCVDPHGHREVPGCGLGAELVALLAAWRAARRRLAGPPRATRSSERAIG